MASNAGSLQDGLNVSIKVNRLLRRRRPLAGCLAPYLVLRSPENASSAEGNAQKDAEQSRERERAETAG